MQICCTLILPHYKKKKLLKIDLCKNILGALSASGESLNSCRLQSHRATCQWRRSQSCFFAEQACWWSQALSCTVAVPYGSKLTALGKGHIVVSITGYYLENLISCPAVGLLSSLLWLATVSLLVTRIAHLLQVIKTQKLTDLEGQLWVASITQRALAQMHSHE